MDEEPVTDLLSGLPRTRPHRRSSKRAKPPGSPAERTQAPAPGQAPPAPATETRAAPITPARILGTAVQASAELAEIGLSMSAQALRRALSRLPRP